MTEPVRTLLPPNTTTLDRAIEQVTAPRLTPALLRTTYDPARIPLALLPWLGWGENVPLWPPGEAQQRQLVRDSHRLHGLIGTATGLRAIARHTGAAVTRLISPPAKTFLGGWSDAARREWLAAHPQLRLYLYRPRSPATGCMLRGVFLGADTHPARTDAPYRSTTRATLWWPTGGDIELSAHEWIQGTAEGNATLELARHDNAPGLHCGQPLHGYTARYTAQERLWRVDQRGYRYGTATLSIRTLSPSLTPLTTDVEIVSTRAPRPGALLFGIPLGGAYTCKLDTETRYYRRTYLHDPNVVGRTTASPSYLGATRLSMPPFHIEASVRMPQRRSITAHLGSPIGRSAPTNRQCAAHMRPTLDALDWMRTAADKILVNTRLHVVLRARQTVIAGAVTAGQIVQN